MKRERSQVANFGLPFVVGFSGLVCGLSGTAWGQAYPPDGPNIPTITLNEGREGAAGLEPLEVPPPHGFDEQSIWNMKVVGFNDAQGRPSSDDGWIGEILVEDGIEVSTRDRCWNGRFGGVHAAAAADSRGPPRRRFSSNLRNVASAWPTIWSIL